MKYTQGPWISTFRINKERGVRSKGGFICFLPKPSHYPNQDKRYEMELEENKANAQLIAAAPEMFEVLKEMTNYLQGMDSNKNVVIRIPFALSKKVGNLLAKIIDHE